MIATDGQRTFVLFIYANIQWGNRATIGFNAGDGVRSIVVTTRPLDVETGSNVGVTGLYINRIDLSSILSPNNGEKLLHGMLLEISWECQNMPTICISNFFCRVQLLCYTILSHQLHLGSTKRPILCVKMQAVLQSMCP